jgi:ABC-2 type transport system ATP-binding protein
LKTSCGAYKNRAPLAPDSGDAPRQSEQQTLDAALGETASEGNPRSTLESDRRFNTANNMIEINHLTKSYGALLAVNDISFTVEPGQVLGFLGPNGAGKSTTMKMITGFLTPTTGSIRVCGHDVQSDPIAAKSCMGYLPEGAPSYAEMTVRSFLDFIANVRNLSGEIRTRRLDDVIQRLGLQGVLEQAIETLSKGFKRRVGLAQALLHDPQVLILDEPTDGLDPNQKHQVRTLISEMSKDKIIVISTHILEEVDAVCNRAIIISGGRLLADDTPKNLASRAPSGRLDDVFRSITTEGTIRPHGGALHA